MEASNFKENKVGEPKFRDYTVGGPESALAIKKGLASGKWFLPFVERTVMRSLMKRDDYHATRDTAFLLAILLTTFSTSYYCWQTGRYGLFALFFWLHCTFYTSCGDSRWHECGHGTAFKTKWKNNLLYNIASFMVFREPLVWRFSHARHHTDTDIVGRDPEADVRPLDMWNLFLAFFNVQGIQGECGKLWRHAKGSLSKSEKSFIPRTETAGVYLQARVWLIVYALVVLVSIYCRSPLPAMYVLLPYSLGAWHFVLVGVFQHASLEQDVLDHRKNTRTVLINPISSFIYWNMQYHVEHHMFPMVPYYNLPKLHAVLQAGGEMPKPYASMWECYREMIPDLIRQCSDPDYFTKIPTPPPLPRAQVEARRDVAVMPDEDGWVAACTTDEVKPGDMMRFDVGPRHYCVYHAEDDGKFYATAGSCTHGAADLADGIVIDNLVECPKHNGCFDFKTGMPKILPVKKPLATYKVKVEEATVFVQVQPKDPQAHGMQLRYDDHEKKD